MTAANTVTVACKAPGGLILEVFPKCPAYEDLPVAQDGKTKYVPVEYKQPLGTIRLRGPAKPIGVDLEDPQIIVGGYALTPEIDADLWDEWLAQNQTAPMVVNRMVYAMPRLNDAKAKGKEQAAVLSNLEPMKANDARAPRGPKDLEGKDRFKIERAVA